MHFTLPVASQVRSTSSSDRSSSRTTSSSTDAFLVFLDGTQPNDQVTFDANNAAVQVGVLSLACTTADVNTAFARRVRADHHLTTTTAELAAGDHTLTFEVGDVNTILDSVAFIADLRAGRRRGRTPATTASGDYDHSGTVTVSDLFNFLDRWFEFRGSPTRPELDPGLPLTTASSAVDDLFGFPRRNGSPSLHPWRELIRMRHGPFPCRARAFASRTKTDPLEDGRPTSEPCSAVCSP